MKQKLQDNINKISKLKKSKNLLIRGFENQKRINDLKIKENNDLKNEIKKLEKSKIELGRLPKLLEDNRARTFVPLDKDEERLKNSATRLKLESIEISEDFDIDEIFRDEKNEYLNINLGDVDDLVGKIKQNVKKINNIIDIANNESINFNDVINFSENIIDGKINNSNKEKRYNEKFKNIEKNLENRTKETDAIKL